jgi:predicted anti-sigma-YlaC factor YlaD
MVPRPASCEQAAQFVSLDLDGELSRFERAMLQRHLARCPRCAEEARRTASLTELLRSVPPEQMSMPVEVSRRRRSRLAVLQGVAGVAVVAIAGAWLGLSIADRETNRPVARIQSQVPTAKVGASDDRFDWQAGGPARGQYVVQFVPGGLRMGDSW